MIRKTIIMVLTLGAVGTTALVALSFWNPLVLDCLRYDRWFRVALTDGQLCLLRENSVVAQSVKNVRQCYRLNEVLDVAGILAGGVLQCAGAHLATTMFKSRDFGTFATFALLGNILIIVYVPIFVDHLDSRVHRRGRFGNRGGGCHRAETRQY